MSSWTSPAARFLTSNIMQILNNKNNFKYILASIDILLKPSTTNYHGTSTKFWRFPVGKNSKILKNVLTTADKWISNGSFELKSVGLCRYFLKHIWKMKFENSLWICATDTAWRGEKWENISKSFSYFVFCFYTSHENWWWSVENEKENEKNCSRTHKFYGPRRCLVFGSILVAR